MYNFLKLHKEMAYNSDIPNSSCLAYKNTSLSKRNKFNFEVKWYIIVHCSQSGWNTHMWFKFKGLHTWKLSRRFKAGNIIIWFRSRCWFDLLFTMATGRKKIAKVDQTMPFCHVVPKWVETISNLKRHIYRKHEQVASYNKHKDERRQEKHLST